MSTKAIFSEDGWRPGGEEAESIVLIVQQDPDRAQDAGSEAVIQFRFPATNEIASVYLSRDDLHAFRDYCTEVFSAMRPASPGAER